MSKHIDKFIENSSNMHTIRYMWFGKLLILKHISTQYILTQILLGGWEASTAGKLKYVLDMIFYCFKDFVPWTCKIAYKQ